MNLIIGFFIFCLNMLTLLAQQNHTAPAGDSAQNPTLGDIRNEFVGGVLAIRDSAGRIVGWGVNNVKQGVENGVTAVKQGVENVVQPVVDVAQGIANKTVFIKNNFQHAGGQIVDAWGNSIQQTKNITGQLINNLRRKK